MKIFRLLTLPILLLASCSDLNPEDKDKENKPPPEPTDLPPPPELPTDGIDFTEVDTTDALLTEENKKTVTGPVIDKEPIEGDNVINVAPPLPTPSLPDE